MTDHRSSQRTEWRSYWTLVLACAIGFSFSSLLTNAFGFFLIPMSEQFGWSRAEASIGMAVNGLISVLFSPLAGVAVRKWGVRRVALPGLVLLSISIAAFSLATGSHAQWVALWIAYALIDLSVKSTVWTTAVTYAFEEQRALALGVTLTGTSIGQILCPPLAAALIGGLGWRSAFVAIGLGWGAVAFGLALPFLKDAQHAKAASNQIPSARRGADVGITAREAFKSRPILLIAGSIFLALLFGIALQVHLVPILAEGGITARKAAYFLSFGGAAGIVGKVTTGWLMDRFDAAKIGAVTFAMTAIASILLVSQVRTGPLEFCSVVLLGYSAATEFQVCAYLTSRYAGVRHFAVIFACMSSIISLGSGLGPLLAGLIFDRYGTYDPLLMMAALGTVMAGLMLLALRRYPMVENGISTDAPNPELKVGRTAA